MLVLAYKFENPNVETWRIMLFTMECERECLDLCSQHLMAIAQSNAHLEREGTWWLKVAKSYLEI